MDSHRPAARAAIVAGIEWESALQRTLDDLAGIQPDLLVLFVGYQHAGSLDKIVGDVQRQLGPRILIGCTGIGVIGMDQEIERAPALALLAVALPGADLHAVRLTPGALQAALESDDWAKEINLDPANVNGWLLFADPFHTNGEHLLSLFQHAFPGAPVVGGMASPGPQDRETRLILNGEIYLDGAVALAIGGSYLLQPLVSQGCEPIGEPWTITGVQANWIETISNRPAFQVMIATLDELPEDERAHARRNLLIGLATNEYRHDFFRGDFLIRTITGLDQSSGSIAVGGQPRVGQTMQFQVRDAATADLDLTLMLEAAKSQLGRARPVAGILCSCSGRGAGLFGSSHHDANAVARKLGDLPVAGLFCAGEFGSVGPAPFLHGHTVSLGLIVPRSS